MTDFSDYPKDHPLCDETNKKVIGKMKDECAGTLTFAYGQMGASTFLVTIGGFLVL